MGEFILNGRNYGGSIITPNPSDTPTDSLDSIKIDDTTYEIQGGGGGGSNLIIDAQKYSLEEEVIGIWTDGKPLYQKTFYFTTPVQVQANRYETLVTSSGLSIETIVSGEALPSKEATFTPISLTYTQSGDIQGYFPTAWSISYLTIRYTKTTDIAGSGGYQAYGFSPIIYSDVEREVGVWRDGKPLYQKTFYLASCSGVEDPLVADLSSLGIETIVSGSGMCLNVSNYVIPVNYAHQNSSYDVTWLVNDLKTRLELRLGSGQRTLHDIYVTLQYTKASDVAGSGEYNTLAIPNVHYSTDEQVIGTWIDGKPIYQKTFTSVNIEITNANTWYDTGLSASGIANFIDGKMMDKYNYQFFPICVAFGSNHTKIVVSCPMGNREVENLTIQYTKTT